LTQHALTELANDKQVRQASEFRKAAEDLSGEKLAALYEDEQKAAPDRHAAERRYLLGHEGTLRSVPKAPREEHLAMALVNRCREAGQGIELPDGGGLDLIDYQVPLAVSNGPGSPGPIDLLGIAPENRLAVVELKFVRPSATRGATGETPLRALLEALAGAAVLSSRREALTEELKGELERSVSDEPPLAIVLGNARYWELCRKREAQRGAAWIAELERLASEIGERIRVQVRFLCVKFDGDSDPGWSYPERRPTLDSEPELVPAWEASAGRVRPRTPRTSRPTPEPEIVEADPTRPVRPYALTEIFEVGDAISHKTLGHGVVQRVVGPTKIEVRFDGENKLLVYARQAR
jgi:hypothetical protein